MPGPAEEFASQVRTNAEFFAPAFAEFNNRATIRFFERQGVKLDIERGERVFPHSGKAWDIANALLDYCVENGVKILYDTRVTGILTLGDRVFGVRYRNKRGFERKEECAQVILATGGVSYPGTGSTGDGYAFASDLGHTIEPLRPSLTPARYLAPADEPSLPAVAAQRPCDALGSMTGPSARSSASWASPNAASRGPWPCA